jgi:cell division septum initiation protein DivIVA
LQPIPSARNGLRMLQTRAGSSRMVPMDRRDLRAEAKRFRSAELPRAIRGFDEEQTRSLLTDAAKLLESAAEERETLGRELERLRSDAGKEVADKEAIGKALVAATRAAEEITAEARAIAERITTEAEVRAKAILGEAAAASEERELESLAARGRLESEIAAARAAAEEELAVTRADLERQRERLEQEQQSWRDVLEHERSKMLADARAQADAAVADAQQEVERLQDHGDRLRALLADSQRQFVALAESALRQLGDVEAASSGSAGGELLDSLRPSRADETPAPSAVADD